MSSPPAASRSVHLGVTPWVPARGEDPTASLIRQAQLAEQIGLGAFFLPESHLHRGARPAPLVTLAALAGATNRIRLGTTSLLLPLRSPLLLAEEIAVLDRVSNGRLILGLGRGFRRATFEAFGLDPTTKRERFEQVLASLLRAWGVEPDWPNAPPPTETTRVQPLPLQRPHPPLWAAAFGPKAIAQAARLRLAYFASPMESHETVARNLKLFREHGAEPGDVPVMRTLFVSTNASEVDEVAKALLEEQDRLLRSRSPIRASAAANDLALLGEPDAVVDRLLLLGERLGWTHLVVRLPGSIDSETAERSLRALVETLSTRGITSCES